jgi:hypothetical protein
MLRLINEVMLKINGFQSFLACFKPQIVSIESLKMSRKNIKIGNRDNQSVHLKSNH